MEFHKILCTSVIMMFSLIMAEVLYAHSNSNNFVNTRDIKLIAANSASNATVVDMVRYNPAAVYSGPFNPSAIYYHNRRNPTWYLGLKQELDFINCRSAQDSFRKTGTWIGHISQEGSCVNTTEPAEWAVGNWLNFSNAAGKR